MIFGKKELILYETETGKAPFEEWLQQLKDSRSRAIIRTRLDRLEHGNPGKYKAVSGGIYELKIDFGPGYRIYFGEDGKTLIILLCGGDKSTQEKDIRRAREYWKNYGVKNETIS